MTMKGTTDCAVLIFLVGCIFVNIGHGRVTELSTERLPIMAHKLRSANIDLKFLSTRAQLGPRSGFNIKNKDFTKTVKGGQRARLIQTYASYVVYGPAVAAELDMDGHFTGHLHGEVARNLHIDIPNPEACKRNVQALLNIAIRSERLNPADPNIVKKDGRRVIYANPDERKAKIVYVVEFLYTGYSYASFPVYYMDACANSIMFSYNKIKNMSIPRESKRGYTEPTREKNPLRFRTENQTKFDVNSGCSPSAVGVGGNGNTGTITYNTPPACLPVTSSGSTCTFDGPYAKVVDNENSKSEGKTTIASFDCGVGYRDAVNGANGVANDAAYYGEMSGRFFFDTYGIKALNQIPRMVVHYGTNYENAFWTGTDMFFGDGASYFYPLVSLDVVAHELAHGFTSSNSDLIYRGQSGGINEAFSDITGAATVYFVRDTVSWNIGEDLMKSGSGALRYMSNPPRDGRSIKNVFFYHLFMDVHHSSGIFNYAFYIMVDRYEIPMYKAFKSFLIANKDLWGMFTGFRSGACKVVQASYDDGTDYKSMRKAFLFTWMPLIFCNSNGLKTTLFPGESRKGILVGAHRSPILEINMTHWTGRGVHVQAEDRSAILVLAATDGDASDVIAQGINYVKFPANHLIVHVKLMSDHKDDVTVTLHVLN